MCVTDRKDDFGNRRSEVLIIVVFNEHIRGYSMPFTHEASMLPSFFSSDSFDFVRLVVIIDQISD